MSLTNKQQLFVKHYMVNMNATDAYRKAYGDDKSDNTCAASGAKLLRNAKIAEAVAKVFNNTVKKLKLDEDFVLDRLVRVYDVAMESKNYSSALKALELIGKHLGMFKDKVEVNAGVNKRPENNLSIQDVDRRLSEIVQRGESSDITIPMPN